MAGLGAQTSGRKWPSVMKGLLLDQKFRSKYIKQQRRSWWMFWKYDSYVYIEKYGLVLTALGIIYYIGTRKMTAKMLRLPTEDVNELLKSDVWLDEKNEIASRKEYANRLLQDSNYIHERNTPVRE